MLTGTPPFYSPNRDQMFKNILSQPLSLKPYFSPETSDLLQKLLENNVLIPQPHHRLSSVEEAKRHPFFRSINWPRLYAREINPPFRPKINSGVISSEDQKVAESPPAPMTSLEKQALMFEQFTYNEAAAFN